MHFVHINIFSYEQCRDFGQILTDNNMQIVWANFSNIYDYWHPWFNTMIKDGRTFHCNKMGCEMFELPLGNNPLIATSRIADYQCSAKSYRSVQEMVDGIYSGCWLKEKLPEILA